jgi:hypothetical protein
VQPIPSTASFKPKRRLLKWGGAALLLLIAGGIGAGINQESNRRRVYLSTEDQNRLDRARKEEQILRMQTESVAELQERLRRQLDLRLEEITEAKEAAERAAERDTPFPADEKPLNLRYYEYEPLNVASGTYSRIPGKELLTQRTKDDLETISQFYQKKLGAPFIVINRRDNKRLLFQSPGSPGNPSVSVLVRDNDENRRQFPFEIIILRSPFPFPQPQSSAQKEALPAPPPPPPKPLVEPAQPAKPAAKAAPAPPDGQN